MSPGLILLSASYPRPNSWRYPGRNDSIRKSAVLTSLFKYSRPSWVSMSTVMLLLFVLNTCQDRLLSGPGMSSANGPMPRAGSPPGLSILMMSAPSSARSFPQYARSSSVRSKPRYGNSGPDLFFSLATTCLSVHYQPGHFLFSPSCEVNRFAVETLANVCGDSCRSCM